MVFPLLSFSPSYDYPGIEMGRLCVLSGMILSLSSSLSSSSSSSLLCYYFFRFFYRFSLFLSLCNKAKSITSDKRDSASSVLIFPLFWSFTKGWDLIEEKEKFGSRLWHKVSPPSFLGNWGVFSFDSPDTVFQFTATLLNLSHKLNKRQVTEKLSITISQGGQKRKSNHQLKVSRKICIWTCWCEARYLMDWGDGSWW